MKQKIKAHLYDIIADKVDECCGYASHRIYKYNNNPSKEEIKGVFYDVVMAGLAEIIVFDE